MSAAAAEDDALAGCEWWRADGGRQVVVEEGGVRYRDGGGRAGQRA